MKTPLFTPGPQPAASAPGLGRDLSCQLAQQQANLQQALRAGADTAAIRSEIAATERGLADQVAAHVRHREAEAAAADQRLDDLAADRLAEVRAAHSAVLANFFIPGSEAHVVQLDTDPEHRAAVATVETAQRALSQASAVLDARAVEAATLADRVHALEDRRAAMATRRRHGDVRPDDGEELGLIALDLPGVQELHGRAHAAMLDAADTQHQHLDAVAAAERNLHQVEHSVMLAGLLDRLAQIEDASAQVRQGIRNTLDGLDGPAAFAAMPFLTAEATRADTRLNAALDAIEAVLAKVGQRSARPWAPSQRLFQRLRQIASARGQL